MTHLRIGNVRQVQCVGGGMNDGGWHIPYHHRILGIKQDWLVKEYRTVLRSDFSNLGLFGDQEAGHRFWGRPFGVLVDQVLISFVGTNFGCFLGGVQRTFKGSQLTLKGFTQLARMVCIRWKGRHGRRVLKSNALPGNPPCLKRGTKSSCLQDTGPKHSAMKLLVGNSSAIVMHGPAMVIVQSPQLT